MFTDGVLEKIFSRPELRKIPIGYQSTIIHAIEGTFEDILEENPYVTVSELLGSTNAEPVSEL